MADAVAAAARPFAEEKPERATQVAAIAELCGVSPSTVYRALNLIHKPHAAHRAEVPTPTFRSKAARR
ncbi:TetR family transcriptional regulator [Pseudomonas marginalis]|uniref:TetR family transcriptional regulator n=1 Tax=Pseudomonas fluorescens TaxID=294 RepID=UPI001CCF5DAC|nr:TetR family transcriptional regulator [Pseudomonas fluorescens]WPN26642.1 TetR family transcriptional regulator [Pseudomonas marginalis]